MSRNLTAQLLAFETAPANSRAILLDIEVATVGTLRITDYDVPLVRDGYTYVPRGFEVDDYDSETGRINVTIASLDGYSVFRSLLFAFTKTVNLTVRNAIVDSLNVTSSSYLFFSGRFTGGGYSNGVVSLEASNKVLGQDGAIGTNYVFQYSCPHVLYGALCQATKTPYATTISSFDREKREVTLAGTPTDPTHYNLGSIEIAASGETVFVLGLVSGSTYRLSYSPSSLAVSASVNLYKGCDKSIASCSTIHSNKANFGGFVGIPLVKNSAVDGVS